MKKCIILKQEYIEIGKLKKAEIETAQDKQFKKTVSLFKEQMKEVIKAFKIIKELSPNSVIIEYAEVMNDKMHEILRSADIVEIIDSMIPNDA
jgi:hypothetical protein